MYIVLEGINGSGKSTLANELIYRLQNQDAPEIVVVKEPSSKFYCSYTTDLAIAYAHFADRVETIETVVKPALEAGKIVISDRGYPSTFVYQSLKIREFIKLIPDDFLYPDLVYILMPDLVTTNANLRSRNDKPLEAKHFNTLYTRYLSFYQHYNNSHDIRLDGSGSLDSAVVSISRLLNLC